MALINFARCTADHHRREVEAALALPPLGAPAYKAFSGLAKRHDCLLGGVLTFDTVLLRGAFYAALYRADYAAAPGGVPAKPIDWSADIAPAAMPAHPTPGDPSVAYPALRRFADCVVRADPKDARAVVLSPPASGEEADAFTFLAPRLSDCMPEDTSVSFSKSMVVGLLAEVLYRDARAAP